MSHRRLHTETTINGLRVPYASAKISVFDNSLLYAEGLFETMLAIDDRIVFLNKHLDRLYRGARVIGLKIPVNRNILKQWIIRTVKLHPDRICKLRLTATSGEAARWTGIKGKPQVILSASPHELPSKPYKLFVSEFKVDQDSIFRRIKTLSYVTHATALKRARQKRADDALLLNERNRIAEVTSANIFWVKKGRIYTTPISSGCLEGITREAAISDSRRLGFTVSQKQETLAGLLKADEIFVSSSLKLILGVCLIIDGSHRHRFNTGPVTDALMSRFRSKVGL
jgi:branched-chain amino acid aminotransferase